jgi:hypothetical protein
MYFAKSVTRIVTRLARLIKELQQCHLIGNRVDERDKSFALLVDSRGNRRTELCVPRATQSVPGKSNQYEQHIRKLLKNNALLIHFSDAFLADIDVSEVAKIHYEEA